MATLRDILDLAHYYGRGCPPLVAKYFLEHRVLDVGCGNGRLLQQDPGHFWGVDRNPALVREAVTRGFRACVADGQALPFRMGSFDAVNCDNVIEHLLPAAAEAMLNEIGRVLRPGGTLVIRTLLATPQVWDTFSHVRPYPPAAIQKLLGSPLEQRDGIQWLRLLEIEVIFYIGPLVRLPMVQAVVQLISQFVPAIRRGYAMVLRKRGYDPGLAGRQERPGSSPRGNSGRPA